jgi:hypothetical protein
VTKAKSVNREWLELRFSTIEQKLDEHAVTLASHLEQDRKSFRELHDQLSSYNLRADRVEQTAATWRWYLRTLWGVTVATVIGGVIAIFK